jgi:multiple sugar transport system substrate-binding protein
MKKVSIMLLIGVMVIGSLFAQGSNEKSKAPGKQTVVFWNGYTGPDRTVLEELVKKYNESQNTVEIKMGDHAVGYVVSKVDASNDRG